MLAAQPHPGKQHDHADADQPTDQRRFQGVFAPHPEQADEQQQWRQRFHQAQGIEGTDATGGVVQGQQPALEYRQRDRQQQQPGQQAQLQGDIQFGTELTQQGHADQGQRPGDQAAEHQHLAEQHAHGALLGRLVAHGRVQAAAGGGADQVGQGAEQGEQAALAGAEDARQQHIAQ
ncbi:hypothetical protein D9M71_576110 [compost metagenome]